MKDEPMEETLEWKGMGVPRRDPEMVVIIANNAPKSSASGEVLSWFKCGCKGWGGGLTGS